MVIDFWALAPRGIKYARKMRHMIILGWWVTLFLVERQQRVHTIKYKRKTHRECWKEE
jgi:hypothetical protein